MQTSTILLAIMLPLLSFCPNGAGAGPPGAAEHQRLDWLDPADESLRVAMDMDTSALDAYIEALRISQHVPGIAALIVKDGEVFWTGAYGWADVDKGIPVADTTSFMLASVSKTITGLAMMQAWEEGLFELDDDIDGYLPFEVNNYYHPNDEITFRMLMTHSSSLNDNWSVLNSVYSQGDSPIPLSYFMEQYWTPGGEYYYTSNFNNWAPGAAWDYCNQAVTLTGYLVEVMTDTLFDHYCRDSIFTPLGMSHTSFRLADLDTNNVAMPYLYSGGNYIPYGHFSYADYPAGSLFSSTLDLARHLIAFMQYGRIDTVRVLDSATVDMMRTPQIPGLYAPQCLIWFYQSVGGRWTYSHGGGDQGVATTVSCCPDEGTGAIVLVNSASHSVVNAIVQELYDCARRYGVYFETDTSVGWAPYEVAFAGSSQSDIENWIWDFGDGDSAFVQSPIHTFESPGVFQVLLRAITVGGDTLLCPRSGTVAVLADTLWADTVETSADSAIELTISVTNFVPLDDITIPIEFAGELDLDPPAVSWTNESCRTELMGAAVQTHLSPLDKQMTFNIAGPQAMLPGSGPVLKVFFQTNDFPSSGEIADVVLDGYASYLPRFYGPLADYTARSVSGAIIYIGCCEGVTGNIDGDPAEKIDIVDLVHLVTFMFQEGPPPVCMAEADIDGNGTPVPDIADLVYLVTYMFQDGPALTPCP